MQIALISLEVLCVTVNWVMKEMERSVKVCLNLSTLYLFSKFFNTLIQTLMNVKMTH